MAVSFIQGVSANASSVNLNSQAQKGDLIIVMAYNDASTTTPSLPSGYTLLKNATGTAQSGITGFRISDGTDTTSGTWTNATNVVCLVYRGARSVGASATPLTGNSATITYPAVTLQRTDGSSWVAAFCGAKAATAGMNGTTAALTANRTNQTTVNGLDTNGGVTSFASQTLTVTGSGRFITFSSEILATVPDDEDEGWMGSDWLPDIPQRQILAAVLAATLFCAVQTAAGQDDGQFAPQPTQTIVDEDYWINPVAPVTAQDYQTRPYLFTDQPDDYVSFSTDEDFWQNSVAPVKLSNYVVLPLGDPEEIPANTLFGQPDEDFWIPPVWPVIFSTPRAVLSDDDVIFSQPVTFQPDEDYLWPASVPCAPWMSPVRAFTDDDAIFFFPDEDFWTNHVFPAVGRLSPLYMPDPEEIPSGSLFGQPDEDFWINPVRPVSLSENWPQQFSFDVQEPAGSLFGEPDEDLWLNWVRPLPSTLAWPNPWQFDQNENAAGLYGQPDEDFWCQPQQTSWAYRPNIFIDSDDLPITPAQPVLDEDYWWQAARSSTVAPRLFISDDDLPITPAPQIAEEDCWQQYSSPSRSNIQPAVSTFDQDVVYVGLDEDYSPLSVSSIWLQNCYPQQWIFDDETISSAPIGQIDEDYWFTLTIAPLWPSQCAPFIFDEILSGTSFTHPVIITGLSVFPEAQAELSAFGQGAASVNGFVQPVGQVSAFGQMTAAQIRVEVQISDTGEE